MTVQNKAQLITYPDSLGGNLKTLRDLLDRYCAEIVPGGVHILPPYPSSADRGFAPLTYFEIEPRFGSWDDIRSIGRRFPVMVDMMVNHISRQSPYFQDFLRHGRRSEYADLFLTLDKVWPGGKAPAEDVAQIFLRRPLNPFTDVTIQDTGEVERIWATFGTRDWSEQIDFDVNSPATRKLFTQILEHFSQQRIRMVRLDAVAYVNKKPGTSCFFVEPDLYEFLAWIRQVAGEVGIELLPEVHAHYSLQDRLAGHGLWVYNFALPLLVLHTLLNRSSQALVSHLRTCPLKQVTTLDSHDGIPVLPDIEDLLDLESARNVVDICLQRGGNLSRLFSTRHMPSPGFDAHQINCTYYSALGGDDDAYLAARAIQLFAPGIPQIYYVGLLAGENDLAELKRTGEGRSINRHNYSVLEVEQAFQKPVVQRLLPLIRLRNEHPAFAGEFSVLESTGREVRLAWQNGPSRCSLRVDLDTCQLQIEA